MQLVPEDVKRDKIGLVCIAFVPELRSLALGACNVSHEKGRQY